jgi:SAM-dependent methyltransferase
MASHARKELGLDVHTARLSEAEADLAAERFDAVCAFHVVEHLPDPLGAMQLIRRTLRPGGHLLIEVPNAQSRAARRQGKRWKPLDLPHHLGHHSPASLRELLSRAGLEPLSLDTVPFAYYSAAAAPVRLIQGALEGLRGGAPPSSRPHPSAHQLLRASARRAAA